MAGRQEYTELGGKYSGGTRNAASFGAERYPSADVPGISFLRNRFYDQQTGRWTQEDPLGVAGGLNLYQFNGNNPVSNSDPFGLCPNPPGSCVTQYALAGAALGGTLGTAFGALTTAGIAIPLTTGTGVAVGGAFGALVGAVAELTGGSEAEDVSGPAGGKSASEYDKHVQGVADAQGRLQGLEERLSNTKGPKTQKAIREQIERLKKDIKGHEKEIRQKWPQGGPE